ncbi:hypothetical protein J1N35_019573 [Gossypium stocksii]|uniref:Reverse transcriptase domain-containing protein n=1 Tax=Gossypium stocksii TaxID=47602 RepID=A0A9D3VR62_9ROSI|nr:hypothetical protein J1N35_019573 [Gossypium stocksii]
MNLFMHCVGSISYTVGLNGLRGAYFEPFRGVRQGDPLSPYLFLICAQAPREGAEGVLRVVSEYECFNLARLETYPFVTRRSLLGARGLLQLGTSCWIGTGASVNIWNDSWIPGPASNLYPFYGESEDSVDHLLRFYSITRQLLTVLKIDLVPPDAFPDYRNWLQHVFQTSSKENQQILAITYWAIWFSRNQLIHGGGRQTVQELAHFVLGHFKEFNVVVLAIAPPCSTQRPLWCPPGPGVIKFNFDASFNVARNASISGILARNEKGQIMGA